MRQSNLNERQLAQRASDKIEAKLFYAYKDLEELELKFEGIIPSKLDKEQIAESIVAQKREVDTLLFIEELVQSQLSEMNRAHQFYRDAFSTGC